MIDAQGYQILIHECELRLAKAKRKLEDQSRAIEYAKSEVANWTEIVEAVKIARGTVDDG